MTVFELGDPVSAGDKVYDAVSGTEYKIDERGFPPARSAATAARLHWSREVAVTVSGKCVAPEGRLLFAGPTDELQCRVIKCRIASKNDAFPLNVPVVGAIRLRERDCPGVLLMDESLHCKIAVLDKKQKSSIAIDDQIAFVCVGQNAQMIELVLNVDRAANAPNSGRLLDWIEKDEPIQMA